MDAKEDQGLMAHIPTLDASVPGEIWSDDTAQVAAMATIALIASLSDCIPRAGTSPRGW